MDENIQLGKELEQARLEFKLERQNRFATNQQKNADSEVAVASSPEKNKKKKGPPIRHPGWFRPTSTDFDWSIEVAAPRRCPQCESKVSPFSSMNPVEHLQEDIIDNVCRVVCYRHQAACCDNCGKHVQ